MKKAIISAVIVIVAVAAGVLLWETARRDELRELRQAIYAGDVNGLDELLKHHSWLANAKNIDAEQKGWTPLHMAACIGNTQVMKVLLDHHANTEARDKRGLTPLLWTAFVGKPEAAEFLLSNGADINAKGRDGRTTLDQAKISLNQDLITVLRAHGAKE